MGSALSASSIKGDSAEPHIDEGHPENPVEPSASIVEDNPRESCTERPSKLGEAFPQTEASQSKGGPAVFQGSHGFNIYGGNFIAASGNVKLDQHVHYHGGSATPNYLSPEAILSMLLDQLPKNKFRSIQKDTFAKRTPGTGSWFIESKEFQAWVTTHGGILWGTGIPGAGKTVLASIVIDYVEKLANESPDISVAFVYCRYSETMSVVDILLAMVRQQLIRHPFLISIIGPALSRSQRENTSLSQSELLDLLVEISKYFKTTIYCLDALDESPTDAQFDLLQTIASVNANFFITSRPLQLLRDVLSNAVFVDIASQDQDIRLFVEQKVTANIAFRILLDKHGIREETVSKIVEKSGGMFLHASLQIETLRHCHSVTSLRRTMDGLPLKVEDMYALTMKRITDQPGNHGQLVKLILVWIIYTKRSITFEELQFALTFLPDAETFDVNDVSGEQFLLTICCGLVTVDKESRFIRLIHYTAKDTLKALISADIPHPHTLISAACIARLASCDFQDSKLQTVEELQKAFNENPLLKYAYESLQFHLLEGNDPQAQSHAALFILQCHAFPYMPYSNMVASDKIEHLKPLHVAAFYNATQALHQLLALGEKPTISGQYRSGVNVLTGESGVTALMVAAREGREEILQTLLDVEGIDVNLTNQRGVTAFHYAAGNGNEKNLRRLLKYNGIAVGLVDHKGWTPLMTASRYGREGSVRLLLDVPEIGINQPNKEGGTALMYAARMGHQEVTRLLLGAPEVDASLADEDGVTALMYASSNGYEGIARLLLDVPGVDVNQTSTEAWTALIYASRYGHQANVRLLLDVPGIKANLTDKWGWTALLCATAYGHEGAVQALLGVPGIDANEPDEDGWTPLVSASRNGYPEIVKLLLGAPGIEVNRTDGDGWTPLLTASRHGYQAIVELLLNAPGIDATRPDNDGWSPLQSASRYGYDGIVQLLLKAPGVDVNAVDHEGWTPLLSASCGGHEATIQFLLQAPGINVNATSNYTSTALSIAATYGHEPAVKLLLNHPGIRTDIADEDGDTALMMASQRGHLGVVKMLIAKISANEVNAREPHAWTPLMLASSRGHEEVVRLLLEDSTIEVDLGDDYGFTALAWALTYGHDGVAKILREFGAKEWVDVVA